MSEGPPEETTYGGVGQNYDPNRAQYGRRGSQQTMDQTTHSGGSQSYYTNQAQYGRRGSQQTGDQPTYSGAGRDYSPDEAQYSRRGSQITTAQYDNSPFLPSDPYGRFLPVADGTLPPQTFHDPSQHYAAQTTSSHMAYHGQDAAHHPPLYASTPSRNYFTPPAPSAASPYAAPSDPGSYFAPAAHPYDPNDPSNTAADIGAILDRLQASTHPRPAPPGADMLDFADLRRKVGAQVQIFRLRNEFRHPGLREYVEAAIAEFEDGYKALEDRFAEKVFVLPLG